jgi:hypothetical protein
MTPLRPEILSFGPFVSKLPTARIWNGIDPESTSPRFHHQARSESMAASVWATRRTRRAFRRP